MATARNHVAITKSDATTYSPPLDAVYVGVAGDVAIKDRDGTNVTYTAVAGGIIPVQASLVMSTGTTASGLVGLIY